MLNMTACKRNSQDLENDLAKVTLEELSSSTTNLLIRVRFKMANKIRWRSFGAAKLNIDWRYNLSKWAPSLYDFSYARKYSALSHVCASAVCARARVHT